MILKDQQGEFLYRDLDSGRRAQEQEAFWPAVAIFVVGWIVFAWPWLSGRVTIPWDAKAEFLPQVQFLAASIWRGDWPFWSPNTFSGHPQIADPQSQMFSPPMLLLALLNPAPGNHAIDVTVLLCLLGAGTGVLLLFRDLDWHPAGGLVAAFGFAFGAAMAWRLQHFGQVISLAYLPCALLLLRRALEHCSAGYGLGAGLVSGLIVTGRDQVALLEVYVLAGFVVAHLSKRSAALAQEVGALMRPLAAGAAGGIAVSLLPVLLTALLAGQSNRPEIDLVGAGRGSLHPALLLTAAAPHLYGAAGGAEDWWGPPSFTWVGTDLFTAQNVGECYIGAIPLALMLVGLRRGWLWARDVRFYSIAFAISVLYGLGWFTPAFRVMYDVLPGVSLYRRPADAVFLIGGLGALLAGYSLSRLLRDADRGGHAPGLFVEVCAVTVLLVAGGGIAAGYGRLAQATPALILAVACFTIAFAIIAAVHWLQLIRPLGVLALVGGATAVDLAINNGPNGATGLSPSEVEMLEPSSRSETLATLKRELAKPHDPARRDRVELVGLGFNWPNAALTHGLENTLGYNPVRLAIYSAATGAEDHSGLPDQRKFSPLFPSYHSMLADLLGLRWIASGVPIEQIDKRLQPGDLHLVAHVADGWIYENPRALPRVMFAPRALPADFKEMLRTGAWPAGFDPSTTVLLEGAEASPAGRPGTVTVAGYRNTAVDVSADSPDGGWVVLNDVWQAWWRAEVDGKPAPLLRANVIFRAVAVPPGKHRVHFMFEPIRGAIAELMGTGPRIPEVPEAVH